MLNTSLGSVIREAARDLVKKADLLLGSMKENRAAEGSDVAAVEIRDQLASPEPT